MITSMIKLSNVSFAYNKNSVFNDLSMELYPGSVYGLLGKNGAGKTTLLKLISGLLFAKTGNTSIDGFNPEQRDVNFLEQVFVLPEEFELPRMNIMKYASISGIFYPTFSSSDLEQHLKTLNVDPSQPLHKMSFGQKKKAYIAFALACNTRYLLMDEPTNGLDIPSKGEFRRLLSSIATLDRTIIISTHQVRDLDKLIDAVVILDDSNILLNASESKITNRLVFKHIEPKDEPIYSERTIHGIWGICRNDNNIESEMDMELLFNAVVSNPELIKEIFN